MSRSRLAAEDGFTLVELMMAALVLVVGVLGVLSLLDHANRATERTKHREAATNLAREVIEASRAVPYPDLIAADFAAALQAQPGLADSVAGGEWTIRRRDATYTIVASVCSVDDDTIAADGLGEHTGGTYCAGQRELAAGQPVKDNNPDDYKRVAVDVRWNDRGVTRTVRQEAVINNPGSAFAPAVKALTMLPASPITSIATTTLTYAATTTVRAQRLGWAVDNVDKGIASGSGTSWSFSWPIGDTPGAAGFVEDGTYLVSAQAFDDAGESGTGRTLTVVLNRFAPRVPTGFTGGRNGDVGAEFEWSPNTERDIVGYRVYRAGVADPVCQTSVDDAQPTYCRDTAIPATGTQQYSVVALAPARSGTGVEESAHSTALSVGTSNAAPTTPRALTAIDAQGTLTLRWTASNDADGIRYYRIYRDGVAYADRYDRTGSGAQLTYTDTEPGAGGHTYYVTAVDQQLAESAPTDGVTG